MFANPSLSWAQEAIDQSKPTGPVAHIGDLRKIASNTLNQAVPFSTLNVRKHLYGIGMPQGLDREIAVFDGEAHLASFDDSHRYSARIEAEFPVTFFVYAYVPKWQEVKLPDRITSFAALEAYLPGAAGAAGAAGLDASKPFPFRLKARAKALNWFVVGGMGNGAPDHRASFARAQHLGGLEDRSIETIGFHTCLHRGVLTGPDTNVHMH